MDNQTARIEALEQHISDIIKVIKTHGWKYPLPSPEVIAEKNKRAHEYIMRYIMIIFYACLLSFGVGCTYNYFTWNIKHKLPALLESTCHTIIGVGGFGTLLFGFALLCEKFQIQF